MSFYAKNKALIYSLLFLAVYSTTLVFAAPPASPYTPSDNITDPTCAPTDTNCYVSVFPDQTSNTGKLFFTDGTSPAWASNLYWDETNDRLGIGTSSPSSELEVVGNIVSKGTKWTSRTSAADNGWIDVEYGNGLFVAIAYSGTGNRVMTSPDGINWTIRSSAADNQWVGLTYGNGLFVAVSVSGTGNRVMTSPDGINWTIRSSAADNAWEAVAYGNGLFVAVARTGTGNRVMTSPDGITWTLRTSAANNNWTSITYANGLFVAVSSTGTGDRVMTSPDGITWTSRTSAADNDWFDVTYGNGLFVAVSDTGTGNRVMTSPDGITWTSRTSAVDNAWRGVTYGNGLFVAVSNDTVGAVGNRVMTSPDGITWTSRSSAADNRWRRITYGNGIFVTISESGTGNRVMTSGKQDSAPLSPSNIFQGGLFSIGSLGVGTSSPNEQLEITGNFRLPTTTASAGIIKQAGVSLIHTYSPSSDLNYQNMFFGSNSGNFTMTGNDGQNVGIGRFTLSHLTTGINNIAIGPFAMDNGEEGNSNIGIGNSSLKQNLDGNLNLAIGHNALENNESGEGNTVVGHGSLLLNEGSDNIVLGGGNATANTSGSNNILIGVNIDFPVNATDNQLSIGNLIFGTGGFGTGTGIGAGNIGIKNKTPSHTLTVGNNTIAGVVARFENSTGTCDINPTTTALVCSSDSRLKKNITSLDSSLNLINSLRPVTYNWNTQSDGTTPTPGFLAQEVEQYLPFLVATDPDTQLKSLNYTLFTPYMIKAIQEVDVKVQDLSNLSTDTPETLGSLIKSFVEDTTTIFERIFIREVKTDKLCLGETCVTEPQLQQLLQGNQTPAPVGGGIPPEDTEDEELGGQQEDENVSDEEQEESETPTPEEEQQDTPEPQPETEQE